MRRLGGIGVAWFVATVLAVLIAATAVSSVRSEVTDVPTALGVSASPPLAVVAPIEIPEYPDGDADLERVTTTTLAPVAATETTEAPAVETTTTTTEPPASEQVRESERQTQSEDASDSRSEDRSTSSPTTTQPARTATTSTTTSTTAAATATTIRTTVVETTTTKTLPPTSEGDPPSKEASPRAYTRVIETEGGSLSVRVKLDEVTFRRAFPYNGWRFDLLNEGPEEVEARFARTDDRSVRIRVLITVVDGNLEITITSTS
ncbi:MAG: hypothetical protein ABFR53_01265 [Actinomycetota bacterium]